HYAFAAIETAVQAGLIQGVGQGRFGLEQPITRQDMAVVFYRALKKLEIDPVQDEDAKTEDITQAAQYAKDAVAYAMKTRLFPDVIETFVPQATVTSEETISVISKWF
ncbi:S-layer homology domain-containing protein, partial [Peribacillus sp. NPDC056705]